MKMPIKGKEVTTVSVVDPDSHAEVEITIIKLETGGIIGIDTSFFDEELPIYSPFDKGVPIILDEPDAAT